MNAKKCTSTRFSQYKVVRAHEPGSFWRENVIGVVTLLRVLAEAYNTSGFSEDVVVMKTSDHILEVISFCDRERV